jgi:hypothetical protein
MTVQELADLLATAIELGWADAPVALAKGSSVEFAVAYDGGILRLVEVVHN